MSQQLGLCSIVYIQFYRDKFLHVDAALRITPAILCSTRRIIFSILFMVSGIKVVSSRIWGLKRILKSNPEKWHIGDENLRLIDSQGLSLITLNNKNFAKMLSSC